MVAVCGGGGGGLPPPPLPPPPPQLMEATESTIRVVNTSAAPPRRLRGRLARIKPAKTKLNSSNIVWRPMLATAIALMVTVAVAVVEPAAGVTGFGAIEHDTGAPCTLHDNVTGPLKLFKSVIVTVVVVDCPWVTDRLVAEGESEKSGPPLTVMWSPDTE